MEKIVSTEKFWDVSKSRAQDIFKRKGIEDTYGKCSSVCNLVENSQMISNGFEIGVIEIEDLDLNGDAISYKTIVGKSEEKGYFKISFAEIINYIDFLGNLQFGSQTAIVPIMDKVVDGDGISGIVFLQPDEEGFLCQMGFFELNHNKPLSRRAKFLVKKKEN